MTARGRPTDFKPKFVEQARKLCELGATDMELAEFFGIEVRTLYRWKHDHQDFCQALIAGKDACDNRVERSLYNRAVGYSFPAVKIFMPAGAEAPVYAPYTEHVPPDTGAAMNWLKNRRGDQWREKQEITHNLGEDILAAIEEGNRRVNDAG